MSTCFNGGCNKNELFFKLKELYCRSYSEINYFEGISANKEICMHTVN